MTTTKKRGDVHVIDNHQCSSFPSEFQQGRPAPSDQNSAVAPIDKVEAAALLQGIPPGLSPGETAALLAARGLKVFPCEPDSKKPATPRGFKNASTDVHLSGGGERQWVTFKAETGRTVSWPATDCNLAFEPGSTGLLVVDIDPKNGGDESWTTLEAQHGKIRTLEVRTPSGGRHLYFLGTVTAINKQLGRGIDTRCAGGYVLMPPSSVNGKAYRWIDDTVPIAPLPEWIAEILNAQTADGADVDPEATARFQAWQDAGGEGGRFVYHLSLIGDHDGGKGFYDPMIRAAGAGVALGMTAVAILDQLRETARTADRRNHTLTDVKDRLSRMPDAIKSFQAKDARRRREAEEMAAEVAEAEAEETEVDPEFEEVFAAQQAEDTAEQSDPAEQPNQHTETDPQAERTAHEAAVAIAKYRLKEELCAILNNPDPVKRLIKAAMGLGKTQTLLSLLAERTDPANPTPVLRFEREDRSLGEEEAEPDIDALLNEDLSKLDTMSPEIGQVVYAAQRHDLLEAAAEKVLKPALRKRGWSEEDIEENVVILSGRARDASTCLRPEEARLVSAAGGSVSDSLCFKRATATQPAVICPLVPSGVWLELRVA
jgi:hypothetical protein